MVKRIPGVLHFPVPPFDGSVLPNRERPCFLYVDRALMTRVLEDAIVALREYQSIDAEDAADTQALIRERETFLAWVRVQPGPTVYLGIHPVLPEDGDIDHALPDLGSDLVH